MADIFLAFSLLGAYIFTFYLITINKSQAENRHISRMGGEKKRLCFSSENKEFFNLKLMFSISFI